MPAVFYVSYVALWVLVITESLLLLLVYRHFGLMALNTAEGVHRDGLPVGVVAPTIRGATAESAITEWRPLAGHQQLLVFLSPDCGPCVKMAPTFIQLAEASDRVQVTFIVPGPVEVVRRLVEKFQPLGGVASLADDGNAITSLYRVRVTPFAFMIGEDGRIQSKGLCDSLSRLESLLAAGSIALPEALSSHLMPTVS